MDLEGHKPGRLLGAIAVARLGQVQGWTQLPLALLGAGPEPGQVRVESRTRVGCGVCLEEIRSWALTTDAWVKEGKLSAGQWILGAVFAKNQFLSSFKLMPTRGHWLPQALTQSRISSLQLSCVVQIEEITVPSFFTNIKSSPVCFSF